MELWHVLFDILILLGAAMVLGVLCERLKQSAILGYLAAGTLLGPNALAVISSGEQVGSLAELGVALLLFTIGLEFSWPRLKKLGISALGGGAAQVLITVALGSVVGLVFGLSVKSAIAIGAIVALSSTACVLRVLISRSEIESEHGRLALGVLLMQDIAVVPLVLLVTILGGQGSMSEVGADVFQAIAGAIVLVIGLYGVLNFVAPKILGSDSFKQNRDLPILLAIVVGLGSAWASHKLGLSPALGAFVAGMLLAESPFATQIRADVGSLRTLLVTLFFSSIGMLGDPAWFFANLPWVLSVVVAVVVGKAIVVWGVLRVLKVPHVQALGAGIVLAQVGEFSFVLAAAGRGELIDEELFRLLVSVTIMTLFLTPYLIVGGPGIAKRVIGLLHGIGLIRSSVGVQESDSMGAGRDVVIIGFGPAGQAVGEQLKGICDRVGVIDLNPMIGSRARAFGFRGYVGDATQGDVLEHAGVVGARAVVIALPDPSGACNVVRLVRAIAPDTYVIARARYNRHVDDLEKSGAHEIVDEEAIVGEQLAERLSAFLG
ncbi:MAG: cation:proton antiporter [Phycisphaerales bacterium]|nr:cation:proton antiporter [Phycisphaerales bacterium]